MNEDLVESSRLISPSGCEPVGIDNPFNALDLRQPSLIQNPQAGFLASTLGKKMDTDLHAKLDTVRDEDSFVSFVSALAADRADEAKKEKETPSSPYGPGANGWENLSIEHFLESAAAWAEGWKNSPQYSPPTNPWKRCAEILFAGKSYE